MTRSRTFPRVPRRALRLAAAVLLTGLLLPAVGADGILASGFVALGVNDEGHLNVQDPVLGYVGLRDLATNFESLSTGCPCEGWGASYDNAVEGYANEAYGVFNAVALTTVPPGPSPSTFTSALVGDLRVDHRYAPNPDGYSYTVFVTITNVGPFGHGDVRYRRTMDWDVDPTPFNEHVTVATLTFPPSTLEFSSDDGFAWPGPLGPRTDLGWIGPPTGADFFDAGPYDHGAMFDLCFGYLQPRESHAFRLFYGAARTEAAALASLSTHGAQVYSLGQNALDPSGTLPTTFFFGLRDDMAPKAERCGTAPDPADPVEREWRRAANDENA